MRKFLGFMVMVLFVFPLTVNAEDGEQVVENLVDEENIKNEDQEIPVIPEISTNESVSDEEQVDEEGVDFLNGASARIAGTWIQDANGWWYRHEDGSYTKNNWENINGTWFYFDANGYMYTGWLQQGGVWYYLWDNGSMATTWAQIDGKWYYFNPNTGVMHTGWLQLGNTWFYLHSDGTMATSWLEIDGEWYYFHDNGSMNTNPFTDPNNEEQVHYFSNNGVWLYTISLITWDLVDSGGHLDWGGDSSFMDYIEKGANKWNNYKAGIIRKDTASTIEDVTVSDYYEKSDTIGVTSNRGTIRFNTYQMDERTYNEKLNVAIHELGHALGLGHNWEGDVMYRYGTNLVTLSNNDKHSYDAAAKKY